MNLVARLYPCFLMGGCLLMFGCNPASPPPASQTHEHEHGGEHEHHETYADAVAELDSLWMEVKNDLAAGDTEKAHGPVHEIGEILEELPKLAAKEGMEDEKLKTAIDDLFECFDAVDQKIEGKAGKTYEEVAERVDAGMQTVRGKAKAEEK